jgi:hypothetical protein
MPGYVCTHCGNYHAELPRSASFEAPIQWTEAATGESRPGTYLDSEVCSIEGKDFFIKGNIEIPIQNSSEKFVWTVWVSLSKENFERAIDLWDEPRRVEEAAHFGWLSNRIPGYPDTVNLKTNVHTRAIGIRPCIELEPTDHALAIEQRHGITLARADQLGGLILHGSS